ncbi:MAG TPA: flagellar biosynthesis protein FlhF [Campylobacterales bacterium]|nr:flagellar biosynthesis protein FlhF [Campylobacterales bacterium]
MHHENEEDLEITLEEIRAFRKEMLLMHGVLASDMVDQQGILKEVAELFITQGLDKVWVDKHLADFVGSGLEQDKERLIAYVLEEIDQFLVTDKEPHPIPRKIQILIGSTGVGKTTLMGKLGARYAYLLDQPYRVAFYNRDGFKLGAVEQLTHYSEAMEIPLVEREALTQGDYDIVLVDTAGTRGESIYDLSELIAYLGTHTDYRVEVSLVLSATAKAKDMAHMMEQFREFPMDNVIFTKLDETEDRSDIIKFMLTHHIPITYLSVGQEIPEDLMVATNEYILEKFIIEDTK